MVADGSPTSFDLPALAGRIELPDEDARRAAAELAEPRAGALGRLGDVATWLAAVQGRSPAQPFERVRLLAVGPVPDAPDPAAAGIGVTAVEAPVDPGAAADAFAAGLAAADAEIDGGADLIVLTGGTDDVPAVAIIALLAGAEVATVVGHRPGADDRDWMRTCAAVRDTARRGRPVTGEIEKLLAVTGAAELATMAGVLAQTTQRRTPVLIDDLVPAAAALIAQRISYRTSRWLVASHRTTDPAQHVALDRLRLTPLLDYGLAVGSQVGPVLAVQHLQVAAGLLDG